jgi:hypothetical protein
MVRGINRQRRIMTTRRPPLATTSPRVSREVRTGTAAHRSSRRREIGIRLDARLLEEGPSLIAIGSRVGVKSRRSMNLSVRFTDLGTDCLRPRGRPVVEGPASHNQAARDTPTSSRGRNRCGIPGMRPGRHARCSTAIRIEREARRRNTFSSPESRDESEGCCPPCGSASGPHEPVLVELLVEGHAADPQLGGGAEAVLPVTLQRPRDEGPLKLLLRLGQGRPARSRPVW